MAPRDVCYSGSFHFVSEALEVVDESVLESFSYALNDIESTLDDIEISLAPHIFPVCVSLVKSFVQGGRVGLARLKKVLPSIFSSFSVGSPYDVLLECGLIPEYSHACNGYPSFFFHPDLDGCQMIERLEPATRKRKRDIPVSEQLQQTYESARSSWTSPPPSESNS